MNNPPVVIADADAIVAQVYPDDPNHQKATQTSKNLANLGAQVMYPVTAVVEAVTFIQRVLSSGATAYGTAIAFTNPTVEVIEVNHQIFSRAVQQYFSPSTSKKNTLFDCIVAVVAQEQQADAIFSFDQFYKRLGFTFASELK